MDDTALIEKAVSGDKGAFEALLSNWYDVMFKMAYKYCGNRSDAEDITQEACIKLARSIGTFSYKSAFSTWLYRLVINAAIDFQRRQKPARPLEEGFMGACAPDAEDQTYAHEILRQVYALPEKEKTAILLVMGEGMTHAQAAEIMDCKEKTISWYISEARKKLGVTREKERHHG